MLNLEIQNKSCAIVSTGIKFSSSLSRDPSPLEQTMFEDNYSCAKWRLFLWINNSQSITLRGWNKAFTQFLIFKFLMYNPVSKEYSYLCSKLSICSRFESLLSCSDEGLMFGTIATQSSPQGLNIPII